jgi:hypothetical protein
MWLATIQFRCERGTLLMILTCRARSRSIHSVFSKRFEVALDVSGSSHSANGITECANALRGAGADDGGHRHFQLPP